MKFTSLLEAMMIDRAQLARCRKLNLSNINFSFNLPIMKQAHNLLT